MKLNITAIIGAGIMFVGASAASATPILLNQSGCCGTGPFGSVNVTQFAPNIVDVLVTLNSGNGFIDTGDGQHPDFAWSLTGNPALTLGSGGNVTIVDDGAGADWVWALGGSVTTSDNLGTFMYFLSCSGTAVSPQISCGNGASNPNPGPLQFRINVTGITPAWFIASTGDAVHAYFAADIFNGQAGGNGQTGLVWTTGVTGTPGTFSAETPEPATLVLLGTGLVALAARARRRRA